MRNPSRRVVAVRPKQKVIRILALVYAVSGPLCTPYVLAIYSFSEESIWTWGASRSFCHYERRPPDAAGRFSVISCIDRPILRCNRAM